MLDAKVLEVKIAELLDGFYSRRIAKIQDLKLTDTLKSKNPYLYRAVGVEQAHEIVEGILSAYMSSSDEGIFGDAFFEPLARFVAGGDKTVAPAEGIDVAIQTETTYTAIAVKSGTSVFNGQSRNRQVTEFNKLRKRLEKIQKRYDPMVGYAYGKRQKSKKLDPDFRESAGQDLWEELTGDPDFYLKIITLMKDKPQQHLQTYEKAYAAAVNRFTAQFVAEFCNTDGTINWERLVHFNSGKSVIRLIVDPENITIKPGESVNITVTAEYHDGSTADVTADREIRYQSSNLEFVTVSATGLVVSNASTENQDVGVTASYGLRKKKVAIKIRTAKVGQSTSVKTR